MARRGLESCIEKAGDALPEQDRAFLLQELSEGRTGEQAIESLRDAVRREVDALARRIEKEGGALQDPRPTDYTEARKSFGVPLSDYQATAAERERIKKIRQAVPGFASAAKWLQEDELAVILSKAGAEKLVSVLGQLPGAAEIAAVALSGRAKRGWYVNSGRAIQEVFGEDATRFAYLLAALSPQTSVEGNTQNALRVWSAWVNAGRPTQVRDIERILAANVQGEKGEDSVLDAWRGNSIRALATEDPAKISISGPKVNSFALNLLGEMGEVTNDAWMANYSGVEQLLFAGSPAAPLPGKSPGYLAMSVAVRRAADKLGWSPAEVQETVWSWAKTLYEKARAEGEARHALQILKDGDLTHEEIGGTVDFEQLFMQPGYREHLESAGYDLGILEESVATRPPQEDAGSVYVDDPNLRRAAKRLDELAQRRKWEAARAEIFLNMSAYTESIPGLAALQEAAIAGDREASVLLQEIAWDSLSYLTAGAPSAEVEHTRATGLYGGVPEPSIGVQVSVKNAELHRILAGIAQFAKNFNQEQVHVRRPVPNRGKWRTYSDGSYDTPVLQYELVEPLSQDEVQRVIDESGLPGMTVTDDALEIYYVGKPGDKHEIKKFSEAAARAEAALGQSVRGVVHSRSRIWAYGEGWGATAGYDAIEGKLPQQKTDQASRSAARIATRLARRSVEPAQQAPEITEDQAALQQRIAEAYESMRLNALDDPNVRRAYQELAQEVMEQFDALPIKSEAWTGQGEPYQDSKGQVSSKLMRKDVLQNNHLYFYKTEPDSFGPEGVVYDNHPLLAPSGRTDINGEPLLYNDLLRVVHDYFAHTLSPVGFGPKGEEAAWLNHMMMTRSPWARWALTSETRGQNSWVNFRKEVEGQALHDRPFADQKVDLLPVEFLMTGQADVDANLAQLPGAESLVLPLPEYLSQTAYHGGGVSGIQQFSTEFVGTGEGNRVFGWGLYFASQKDIAAWYKESVGGRPRMYVAGEEFEFEDIVGNLDWDVLRDIASGADSQEALAEIDALQGMLADDRALILEEAREIHRQLQDIQDGKEELYEMAGNLPQDATQERSEVRRAIQGLERQQAALEVRQEEVDWQETVLEIRIDDYEATAEVVRQIRGRPIRIEEGGGLYEVELMPLDSEYLNWDVELSKQSEFVQERIVQAIGKPHAYLEGLRMTGGDMYEKLARDLGSDKAASEALHALGIRGNKFLDAGSRGVGGGSHNYVIFHGDDVRVVQQLSQKTEATPEQVARAKDLADQTGDRMARVGMEHKDVLKRVLELQEGAQRLQGGEISAQDYDAMVNRYKPIGAYQSVPEPATADDMRRALHKNKQTKIDVEVEDGRKVGLRLDIPAYKDHNVWVPTIHENEPGKGKGPISHKSFAVVENAVFPEDTHAKKVAVGGAKAPSAVIRGEWVNQDQPSAMAEAAAALNDPAWVQVGFDPERHSYFFDRSSTMPVIAGEKVIQVGGLVLVKNPTFGVKEEFMFQQDRGRFYPDLSGERVIQLTEASDLSSFLHESGHLFLDIQRVWAEKYGLTENQRAMLDWLGVSSFADITVEEHERWAETFEVYLREGKAPSLSLRRAFASFARWLKRIYTQLTDPRIGRAKLDPEITEIFDRLLATAQEIEVNAATPQHSQLFRSKEQAGMTDLQWAEYEKRAERVRSDAEMRLDEKVMREYKRQKSAEWAKEKAPLVEQERERLKAENIYQLQADLVAVKDDNGEVVTEGRMDWHKLRDEVGEIPQGKFIGKAVGGGVDPALYAEAYGFSSVKDMYDQVNQAPTLNDAADQAAEAIMVAKHGDILNDGSLEEEVRESLLNDEQAELVLMELRAAKKKEGWMGDLGMPPQSRLNRAYLKAQAAALIGKMTYKEIRPNKYYNAMIKAAEAAARGEDVTQSKITQLANHYLYKEALAQREKMDKNRKKVRGVQRRQYNPKAVDQEYIETLKNLSLAYDMRKPPKDRHAYMMSVLNFYEGQRELDDTSKLEMLDPNLVNAIEYRHEHGTLHGFEIKGFDQLTSEELQGVVDMLDHLRFVGGQIAAGAAAQDQAARDAAVEAIEEEGGKDYKYQRGQQREGRQRHLAWADIIHSMPSIGNMVRRLDGFKPNGWGFRNILMPLNDGYAAYLNIQRSMHDKLDEYMGDISGLGLSLRDATPYTTDAGKEVAFSSEEIFMMTLYWGNESAREAVMSGFDLTERDVVNLMGRLTTGQLQLANAVWAMNESMWPDLQQAAKNMLGVAPPKLVDTPFTVNGVNMTGGHMQLMYDSQRTELKDERQIGVETSSVVPSRAGSTFQRVGSGGKPPRLSMDNITRSINDKAIYIAFSVPGRDLRAVLNNPQIVDAIERKHGERFYANLVHAVEAVTTQRVAQETNKGWATVNRWLRGNATMMHLAYSIRNVAQQFSAAPIAAKEVGLLNFAGASARWLADPRGTNQVIHEKSKFMRNRAEFVNREAHEYLKKIIATNKAERIWGNLRSGAFVMQTAVDMSIAYPTWYAKYQEGMEQHGEEKRSVLEADQAVAESVGSGSDMHLGRIMQSNQGEFVKTLTLFGSWFNAYYQRLYRSSKGGTNFMNMAFLVDAVLLPIVAANLAQILILDTPDEDEAWWEYMASNTFSFLVATMPIVRDTAAVMKGFTPTTPLAAIPVGAARIPSEIDAYREGRQSGLKMTSDLGRVAGSLYPLPGSGNIWRSLDYVDSYLRGEEGEFFNPYQMLAEGSDKNR